MNSKTQMLRKQNKTFHIVFWIHLQTILHFIPTTPRSSMMHDDVYNFEWYMMQPVDQFFKSIHFRFYKSVLMGILAIQFLMLIALIAFTTVSVQYVQKLIKATAITKYREDVDLQNIIDFIQVKDFTYWYWYWYWVYYISWSNQGSIFIPSATCTTDRLVHPFFQLFVQ